MERTIFLIFLCTAVEGEIGKHFFIQSPKTWLEAQAYCRQHYTDLFAVSNLHDQKKLREAAGHAGQRNPKRWIGLHRDLANTAWRWSGGGAITYQNWANHQADNYLNKESCVALFSDGKWNDYDQTKLLPFYCINITVVEIKKSWEDALEHCRDHQTDLPSLLSETERLLAQKAIQKVHITDPVWIGLRYLKDRWLWVNGDPLVYEDWPQGSELDQQCPLQKPCGALNVMEVWERRDCMDKLHFICI